MELLTATHLQAIEHTKVKIFEDIDQYLGEQEIPRTYQEYISDRKHYIEQIWVNIWLNKATNKISRTEKKAFLSNQGYEVEGIDRKIINSLFRNELREYKPFHVLDWLNETYLNNDSSWGQRYEYARNHYLMKLEEEQIEETKESLKNQLKEQSRELINKNQHLYYVHLRYEMAKQLQKDFQTRKKYIETHSYRYEDQLKQKGSLRKEDYQTIHDFLYELTGNIEQTIYWGKNNVEYESYYYIYERLINDYVFDHISKIIYQELSNDGMTHFEELANEKLTVREYKKNMANDLAMLAKQYFLMIQEERIDDLLALLTKSFDPFEHLTIFENDLKERERKRAEELAEIQRQKEEEARILADIFKHEYSPSYSPSTKYILHVGETNTGKTFQALQRMKEAESGLYLAPLRLLALEVFEKLNSEGVPCSLKTGEEEKDVNDSKHLSSTVEMFHEKDTYEVIVIDEAQMIADKDRGFSWYKAITKANAKEVHIVGSKNLKKMILQLLEDANIEVHEYKRDIPLEVEDKPFNIKNTKKGDALVCFSRRRVLETASKLQNEGHKVSLIYGSMPPETRKKQMQQFIEGDTTTIVSTDAIGMGLNLPIQRIIFLENDKFDGTRRRRLTSQEVKQIAGRAGRKGIYDIGKVAFTKDIKVMKRLLFDEDQPVHTFAIAPTNTVFERFQRYSRDLQTFFDIWDKFDSPKGTKKSTLAEERALYETIQDTEIEVRMPMMELYGFLHLPFSSNEPILVKQWKKTMYAIVNGQDLPDPVYNKSDTLEDLELSYKVIGLHLLFLYRLEQRTEATYWERIREGLTDEIHENLKSNVKTYTKTCKQCGKQLPWDYDFQICGNCYYRRVKKRQQG
ncbi:DEAD/DEAH box helicase [Litchfieldia salsa]|uniref:ATP-dependent RNA helicase SUPV3L1/SUV3 n=1 Tax=Litchfieldia salsa TaxID=930152 RepID=A0A1H0TC96_9BACI|nr:DEAD/DEAH box helicase [Litchfieldia salsa]SDP51310.1 ATP-dependent RNA helicase SUPV3L1/SUV3 [Litchfieldia salsa]